MSRPDAATPARPEAGESLIEILITVMVLSIGVVGMLTAIGNSSRLSDRYRKQAKVDQTVTEVIDAIQNAPYKPCAWSAGLGSATDYDTEIGAVVTSSGNVVGVEAIDYWSPTRPPEPLSYRFTSLASLVPPPLDHCPVAPYDGPVFQTQLLTITVSSSDGRGKRTLQIVKRP